MARSSLTDGFPHFGEVRGKCPIRDRLDRARLNFVGPPFQFFQRDRFAHGRDRFKQGICQFHPLPEGQLDRELFHGGEGHREEISAKYLVDSSLPFLVLKWSFGNEGKWILHS